MPDSLPYVAIHVILFAVGAVLSYCDWFLDIRGDRCMNENDISRLTSEHREDAISKATALIPALDKILSSSALERMNERLDAMEKMAGFNRKLCRALNQSNLIQKMTDEVLRTTAVYQSVRPISGAIEKQMLAMDKALNIGRTISAILNPPRDHFQDFLNFSKRIDSLYKSIEHVTAAQRGLTQLVNFYSRPQVDAISKAIEAGMTVGKLLQANPLADFTERILREVEFRNALIDRLSTESRTPFSPDDTRIPTEQVLEALEAGIQESGIARNTGDPKTEVHVLFAQWNKLPTDLRAFIISVLAGMLVLLFQAMSSRPQSVTNINQQVKIVQKVTSVVFIENGIGHEARRLFRVISKNNVPVFSSNRRDSVKLGTIDAGQIVIVKTRKRNWTEIEWKDATTGEVCRGWVYTRYLKKI